jgi:hypothetical protein
VSCRRRIEALRAGRPFDRANAWHAQESLEVARRRAAAAEEPFPTQPPGWIADCLRERRIAVSALFERYFALSGEASLFDVDGHVHGVINLPSSQRSILEHALWELIELTAD